jgi:adenosylcobinamide kinase/adenosylcobinamide-phosphate guanylyltransferase
MVGPGHDVTDGGGAVGKASWSCDTARARRPLRHVRLAPREEERAIDMVETSLRPVTLILGGAASGKSAFSESLIESGIGTLWDSALYLATATAGDDEMASKIERHRERRSPAWTTVEEPLDLSGALTNHANPSRPILVDCLTLWLSNLMFADRAPALETEKLTSTFTTLAGPVVFVSNEVGSGIVPENALARRFREEAGRLNQAVAAAADRVHFIAAGLPITLKDKNP